MNEGMMVYLNLNLEPNLEQHLANNELLDRLDALLMSKGIIYSGFRNLYYSRDPRRRDTSVIRAVKAMEHAQWLKGIYHHSTILNRTNVCQLNEINTDRMSPPSARKWNYYENYYLQTKKYPHPIVVDENRNIRNGYITYLLAQKYNFCPDVYETWRHQPLQKIVIGRHVQFHNGTARISCPKTYQWIYSLHTPVVKGDILLAGTRNGYLPIVVDDISYHTGTAALRTLRRIKKKLLRWDKVQWEATAIPPSPENLAFSVWLNNGRRLGESTGKNRRYSHKLRFRRKI